MAQQTIRLGVAGGGLAVRDLHWPALQKLGNRYRIVALAARTRKSLEETGQLVGCDNYYHDYKEMIDREKENIDAVLVSLPISMLYEAAEYAARAGLDVLCEKPSGQNLEEGEKFRRLAGETGVSIQILENFRYRDDLKRAREMIDEGLIGDLYMIRLWSVSHSEPEQGGFAGRLTLEGVPDHAPDIAVLCVPPEAQADALRVRGEPRQRAAEGEGLVPVEAEPLGDHGRPQEIGRAHV